MLRRRLVPARAPARTPNAPGRGAARLKYELVTKIKAELNGDPRISASMRSVGAADYVSVLSMPCCGASTGSTSERRKGTKKTAACSAAIFAVQYRGLTNMPIHRAGITPRVTRRCGVQEVSISHIEHSGKGTETDTAI